MHAEAARDPILSTQRIRKVKISMVGIYKVKVRFPSLALAHVSHFFSEREPWALKQSTHFSIFERLEILHLNHEDFKVKLLITRAKRAEKILAFCT